MSLLLKLIIATPAGCGMLTPPLPMIAGYGAFPEEGKVIDAVNEIDLPPSEQLMVSVPPE